VVVVVWVGGFSCAPTHPPLHTGPGSHYCENIGRCHTSNHAFFVAQLAAGRFCQKCYDPDCSSYRCGAAHAPSPAHLSQAKREPDARRRRLRRSPWMELPPELRWAGLGA
jgi:hypothetical protein